MASLPSPLLLLEPPRAPSGGLVWGDARRGLLSPNPLPRACAFGAACLFSSSHQDSLAPSPPSHHHGKLLYLPNDRCLLSAVFYLQPIYIPWPASPLFSLPRWLSRFASFSLSLFPGPQHKAPPKALPRPMPQLLPVPGFIQKLIPGGRKKQVPLPLSPARSSIPSSSLRAKA